MSENYVKRGRAKTAPLPMMAALSMFTLMTLSLGYFALTRGRVDIGIKVKVKIRGKREKDVLCNRLKTMGFKKLLLTNVYTLVRL